MLSSVAKEAGVWVLGGSIPEREEGETRLWNTATVFNPEGQLVAKHRKIHLYDVDIPGGITFFESKSLAPGSSITVFETRSFPSLLFLALSSFSSVGADCSALYFMQPLGLSLLPSGE